MTVPTIPEFDEALSQEQRQKLYAFLEWSHQLVIGKPFIRDPELDDSELVSSALWASQYLGLDSDKLDQFFAKHFGIVDITRDEFGRWLTEMRLALPENSLTGDYGGRN
jgi:hypothetical protein